MNEVLNAQLDYAKIDNIDVENICFDDYPDFCDAYIASADYDGVEMTEDQIDQLNDDCDFVYECVLAQVL